MMKPVLPLLKRAVQVRHLIAFLSRHIPMSNSDCERQSDSNPREVEVSEQNATLETSFEHPGQAQAANLAKSRFLANVSHELRTPLNAFMGFMELLAKTELDAQQRHYVDLSKEAALALLQLIEGLLDSGKIEAGHLELKPHGFRIRHLIRTVLAMHQPMAEQKGLFLRSNIDSRIAEWWYGDEGRIRQVISNLVHNALKFTNCGGVEVVVSLEGELGLRFEVHDTGIGLQSVDCERIFEAFTQLDDTSARQYGGTGLGLSISRQLVKLMGGEIGVRSQPNHGSVFRVILPLKMSKPASEQMNMTVGSVTEAGKLHGRVLVVEDNPLNQALLSEMLKSLGCQVEVVGHGNEALARWQARQFDLVLMDCQLPGMDGYQVVSRMRKQATPSGEAVPIIALTADVSEGIRERCLGVGMVDCLHKPVTVEDLHLCLKPWIGREQAPESITAVVEKQQNPASSAMFDVSVWRQIEKLNQNQDSQLLSRVLRLYRGQGRQCLQTLAQAIAEHNEKIIARTAHRFRSSCVHVGAEDLAQWLIQLENSPQHADARLLAIIWAGYRRVCCLLGAEITPEG